MHNLALFRYKNMLKHFINVQYLSTTITSPMNTFYTPIFIFITPDLLFILKLLFIFIDTHINKYTVF